jgi:hypothetical protein
MGAPRESAVDCRQQLGTFGARATSSEVSEYLKAHFRGIYSEAEVAELIESSEYLARIGPGTCRHKDRGGMEEWAKGQGDEAQAVDLSCGWYHGTWQLLRLLNMVAVPRWYPFYHHALSRLLHAKPDANVLISAAADYGMLATLVDAVRSTRSSPRITLYDICSTPLRSSQWFAERHGVDLRCLQANLLEDELPEAPFDLIVTDEFMTVIKSEDKWTVARRWSQLLAPGGAVVTTAMVGGVTTPDLRQRYAERAKKEFLSHRTKLFPYCTDAEVPAMLARLQRFADYHTRHMLESEEQVRKIFADFSALSCESTCTPGECVNPTYSFQIIATV